MVGFGVVDLGVEVVFGVEVGLGVGVGRALLGSPGEGSKLKLRLVDPSGSLPPETPSECKRDNR